MITIRLLTILVSFLLCCTGKNNSYAADFHAPRTASLGGAGHAGAIQNDAIFLNPSYIGLLQSYSVQFAFSKFKSEPDQFYGRNYSLSLQDGRSKMFQAGAAYTVKEDGAQVNIALAKRVHQQISVGVGGKFFIPNQDSQSSIRDAILSVTYIPKNWIQLALIQDNVFQTSVGKNQANYFREYILGSKFNFLNIAIAYIDPHFTPDLPSGQRWGYEAGFEFTVMRDLFLRLGFFKDSFVAYQNQYGKGFGFGAGWIAPRISLDYAFYRVTRVNGVGPASLDHVFGATIYF